MTRSIAIQQRHTPDLPPEIWLHILQYFPPRHVVRLMGVSRTLFRLSLDYIYQELELILDDKSPVEVYDALRHEYVHCRLRRLLVRAPLIHPEKGDISSVKPATKKNTTSLLQRLPFAKRRSAQITPKPSATEALQGVSNALSSCCQLHEVTLAFGSDLASVTSAEVARFLENLWSTLGSQLVKLNIESTLKNISIISSSLSKTLPKAHSISSLHLKITNPKYEELDASFTTDVLAHQVAQLTSHFASSLTQLSLFSHGFDFSLVLANLQQAFPHLYRFEIRCIMSGWQSSFSSPGSLSTFLARNSASLQHIIIRPVKTFIYYSNRRPVPFDPNGSFWVFLNTHLPQIYLSHVTTLDLGFSDVIETPGSEWGTGPGLSLPFLFPKLVPDVFPNLRSLVIQPRKPLEEPDVCKILDNTRGALEELSISVHTLRPETFDGMVTRCPKLLRLIISYYYWVYTDGGEWRVPKRTWDCKVLASRNYTDWPLEYIRIGYVGRCDILHPNEILASAVQQAVGGLIGKEGAKDNSAGCFCSPM